MSELELNRYYTTKETAQLLGYTQSSIQKLIKNGLLPAKKLGREYRVTGEAIYTLLYAPDLIKAGPIFENTLIVWDLGFFPNEEQKKYSVFYKNAGNFIYNCASTTESRSELIGELCTYLLTMFELRRQRYGFR